MVLATLVVAVSSTCVNIRVDPNQLISGYHRVCPPPATTQARGELVLFFGGSGVFPNNPDLEPFYDHAAITPILAA